MDAARRERTLRAVGMAALLALIGEILLMAVLLPLDATVWDALLVARGCSTDTTAEKVVRGAGVAMVALLAAAASFHVWRHGVGRSWPPLAAVAVGALANHVLKQVFTRDRPSNLAGVVVGHGFPSGHVMNTTMAALAVAALAGGLRRPLWWRVAAATLVAAVAAGRLVVGDHWLLDVVGAVLAAVALTGLALPSFSHRPLAAPLVLAGGLVAVLAAHAMWWTSGLRLPSPLTITGTEIVDVRPGGVDSPASLDGAWEAGGNEEPAGSLRWLRGVASASILMLPPNVDASGASAPPPITGEGLLALTVRPDTSAPGCTWVRTAVNGKIQGGGFVAFRGWREYRLRLSEGTLHRGFNEVQIAARGEDRAPRRLAVARVRLRSD